MSNVLSVFSIGSLMATPYPSNPLKEILDLIPYGDTVLDLELCDKIRVLMSRGRAPLVVTDASVLALMLHLRDAGLIDTAELTFPSAYGKVRFIKRTVNG